MFVFMVYIRLNIYVNKHSAELQIAEPGTKDADNSVPRPYFPTQYPKWIYIIPIALVGKKLTKFITCHGYINNHQFPFIGPIKMIDIFDNCPPWTTEVMK